MLLDACSGNSSLLDFYQLTIEQPSDLSFLPIYIDISRISTEGGGNLNALATKINSELLKSISLKPQLKGELSFDIGLLKGKIEKDFPKTTTNITSELAQNIDELIQKNTIPMLLLDEFDHLENPNKAAPLFRELAKKRIGLFLLGTGEFFAELLRGHVSVLRNIKLIELEPLSKEEFEELFQVFNMAAENTFYFESEAVSLLFKLSGGYPFWGNKFGFLCVSHLLSLEKVSRQEFSDGISKSPSIVSVQLVKEISSTLKMHCSELEKTYEILSTLSSKLPKIIIQLAKAEKITEEEIVFLFANTITLNEIDELTKSHELLAEFIHLTENGLEIRDPCFAQYLRITRNLIDLD